MNVMLLEEAGLNSALLGLSLSFYDHAVPLDEFWNHEKITRAERRAAALAHRDGGHNKFLESIQLWIFVQASRDFWQEFDTYRVGVTKQSASTMHTLDKRPVTLADFEQGTSEKSVEAFNEVLLDYKKEGSPYLKDIGRLKKNLPEGWLQEREVCLNYKALQNIYRQRRNHRLKGWHVFFASLLKQIEHPEFIVPPADAA